MQWRLVVLALAVAAVAAPVFAAAEGVQRVTDPRFGLTIEHAPSLLFARFETDRSSRTWYRGITISNTGKITTPLFVAGLERMPEDAAVFSLFQRIGGPGWGSSFDNGGESRFPLDRASFERDRFGRLPRGRVLARSLIANGWPLGAQVYFGAEASREDQEAIWNAVESLRFRELREGEILHGYLAVARPAKTYRVGSVTPYRGNFIVRAPRGFYVISPPLMGASGRRCDLRFDRSRFEFSCSDGSFRSDRTGRALARRDGVREQQLGVSRAVVAQDGHLLVGLGGGSFYGDPRLERELWGSRE